MVEPFFGWAAESRVVCHLEIELQARKGGRVDRYLIGKRNTYLALGSQSGRGRYFNANSHVKRGGGGGGGATPETRSLSVLRTPQFQHSLPPW